MEDSIRFVILVILACLYVISFVIYAYKVILALITDKQVSKLQKLYGRKTSGKKENRFVLILWGIVLVAVGIIYFLCF